MKAIPYNEQLRRLYEKHIKLERQLSKLSHRNFLTTQEELQTKKLKTEKLRGVDKMMTLVRDESPMQAA